MLGHVAESAIAVVSIQGFEDLFITAYGQNTCLFPTTCNLIWNTPRNRGRTAIAAGKDVPVNCGPRGFPFGTHSLYKNNGDGTFIDVSKEAGIAGASPGYGMTVVAADFDNDGWPDIYVACDSTPSLMFRNKHDGTFEESVRSY